jgi:hypothetical protein
MKRDTTKTASQTTRKLTLKKETLRSLERRQLSAVAGASGGTCLSGGTTSPVSVCSCSGDTTQ